MPLLNVRLWTRQDYHRMAKLRLLAPDERVELIEGTVVTAPAQNYRHSGAITRITMLFVSSYGDTHVVRVQVPLAFGQHSEPEPDFAVLSLADFELSMANGDQPGWAPLVVEVAHTSLDFDRREKASLYARYGIPEYWIVNIPQRRLEVHRGPCPSQKSAFGFDYEERLLFEPDAKVAALFAPDRFLDVVRLF